jgi:HD-GYP domain-containing protein (c-di-GMP phosphodiesterase class II)
VGKQRDVIADTVAQYSLMGDQFRKNFDFQTRMLNLTDEQKLSAETLNQLQQDYNKSVDELRRKLSKAEQSIANSSNGENKNEMIISNFQQQNTDQANLNSEFLESVKFDQLATKIVESNYDFRQFLIAY